MASASSAHDSVGWFVFFVSGCVAFGLWQDSLAATWFMFVAGIVFDDVMTRSKAG